MLESRFFGLKYARRIFPQINADELNDLIAKYSYLYIVGYHPLEVAEYERLDKKTPIINFDRDLQSIFSDFHKTTRNEINKTFANQDLRFITLDTDYNSVHRLHRDFERSQQRTPIPKSELRRSLIFSAYHKNRIIASAICHEDNKILRIRLICSIRTLNDSDVSNAIVSNASRRLIYEICRYGTENSLQFLDFGIVNTSDPAKAGITKFKMSFGGDLVDTYIYRYESPLFGRIRKALRDRYIVNVH